jgi:hypothetical protein
MPKRLLTAASLFIFSLVFIYSCKTDFDVNAPYKEVNVVYGLLELHTGTQVIKISKLYQNGAGTTAYQGAQQMDSLYQKDSLLVTLTDDNTGVKVQLIKYLDTQKDPGIFAAPNSWLFRTPAGFALDKNHAYVLNILNLKTNVSASARTVIVNDIIPERPGTAALINFPATLNGSYPVSFFVGANAFSYNLDIRIPILTFHLSDTVPFRKDTLVWNILTNYTQFQGNKVYYNINGADFFSFLKGNLQVDKNIYRKIDTLDFDFTGAGQELTTYIGVNTPSLGIVQKKPDYTNVSNGIGIFSSRLHNHVKANLSDPTLNYLIISAVTQPLNFRK